MQRARGFFYVCAGIFLLTFAYHLGATSAKAAPQPTSQVAAAFWSNGIQTPTAGTLGNVVVATNGDVYFNTPGTTSWQKIGAVFAP